MKGSIQKRVITTVSIMVFIIFIIVSALFVINKKAAINNTTQNQPYQNTEIEPVSKTLSNNEIVELPLDINVEGMTDNDEIIATDRDLNKILFYNPATKTTISL